MNKTKLYWTLQVGGWLSFALVQIIAFVMLGRALSLPQSTFLLLEAALFLLTTHLYRNFLVSRGWLAYNMSRLIPRVLLAVVLLAAAIYMMRTLVSIPLGMYRPEVAWNATNFIGLVLVYALIFFLWSTLYFIYHYFDRYNTTLKHQAAMNEIELNHLKSQLNPHFMFNALNSIRALVDENPAKSKNRLLNCPISCGARW